MKQEIIELFRKCVDLKVGEFLYTTFGPNNYYIIRNGDTNNFTLSRFKNKWSFQKEGVCLESYDFSTMERLNYLIFSINCIPWYTTNEFSGNIQYLDNWINFIKAFKVANLVEDGDYFTIKFVN